MLSIAIVSEFAVTVMLAQCIYYRYLHPLSRYPGPFLASFSNLWKFFVFFSGKHHLVEQKLHEKYGHVVRIGPNSLSFSSLADFDVIYGFNKSIEKGDFYHFGREKRQVENIFSSRTDASHRERRRKVVGPALTVAKVASYELVISKNVIVLLSRLRDLVQDQQEINVATLIHRYTLDTVVEIIFGAPLCPEPYTDTKASTGLLNALRMMSKMAWGGSLLPWFGWLMRTRPMVNLTRRPTFDTEGNLTGLGAIAARTQDIVILRPEQALKSSQPSIVKNYLSVPADNSSHMKPQEIWRETFNLTFAGPGSTAAALTSLLYRLGSNEGRKWQSNIRVEQHRGLESRSSIPPILTAAIKETLRLDAPFPTAFPRVITPGAESAFSDLPAPLPVGTTVSANTYILGRSQSIWGADAEDWKPERWLQDMTEDERREMEEKFVAFSKGARGCIGKDIAMLMLAKALVGVLGMWEVRSRVDGLKAMSWLEMQYEECMLEFRELAK